MACQWLRSVNHRRALQERLDNGQWSAACLAECRASLDTSIDRFAEWRWKTLTNVTRALERMRAAVIAATDSMAVPILSFDMFPYCKIPSLYNAREQ